MAYEWAWAGAKFAASGELNEAAREVVDAILAEAVHEVAVAQPGLAVTQTSVVGGAAGVLVEAGMSGGLVVVGNRGRGGFSSLLLGSVSQQVATHATGPVVVVRGRDTSSGPVVVGVDGSPAAEHALGLAFEEAAARGCELMAVRAHPTPVRAWGVGAAAPSKPDSQQVKDAERDDLTAAVATWREKYPQVPVETLVPDGNPVDILTGVSRTAQLIVVGTRGHGSVSSAFLGSVSLHLLHHADCPVLIAHTPAAG
jgi:nucleotide-binding universal stress UspA family protein